MKALIIVDVQKGLTKRKGLYNDVSFIDTINYTIEKCRKNGNLIIFTQHNNKYLTPGTNDWNIDNRICKKNTDKVIRKFHGNAFDKTELKAYLHENNVCEILVSGLVSHGCVLATCLGGLKYGFKTYLLKGGHTNWHKNAKELIISTENDLTQLGIITLTKENV